MLNYIIKLAENTIRKSCYNHDIFIKNLLEEDKYKDKRHLNRFENKVFSQFGEDGIIQEILNRIGSENNFFLEIGVGDGLENNTANLLLKEFSGIWIDCEHKNIKKIRNGMCNLIKNKKLKVIHEYVDENNILKILEDNNTPKNIDVLSLDIDGNDYYVIKEILKEYKSKLIILEYNSSFDSDTNWIMPYNKKHMWNNDAYYGASLKSFNILLSENNYVLVCCNLSGNNAFFIDKKYISDKFISEFSVDFHYQPPRYFIKFNEGHKKNFNIFNLNF